MSRKAKRGLDAFMLDTDMFEDIKVRKLIRHQGAKAIATYIRLLCSIYDNGYYVKWDEELPFTVSGELGCEEAYVREVVLCCVRLGLFDEDMFREHKVLTALSVQIRYSQMISRRNIKISEYSLLDDEEPEEVPIEPQPQPQLQPQPIVEQTVFDDTRLIDELFTHGYMMQNFCRSNSISFDKARQMAVDIINEWQLTGEKHYNLTAARKHLLNTIRIRASGNAPAAGRSREQWKNELQGEALRLVNKIYNNPA